MLLVIARCFLRPAQPYDFLLGLARDYGSGPDNCRKALEQIVRRACTVRRGRRANNGMVDGEKDVFRSDLYETFRRSVRSAVADGGPTEQRALFDTSAISTDPECRLGSVGVRTPR